MHHAVIGAAAGAGGVAESRASGRFNVVWELGQNSTIYPDVLGVKLAAGSVLNFDVHTHSIGTEATLSIEVAFTLHPRGYQPKYTNAGSFNSLTYDLDIPGNTETVDRGAVAAGRGPGWC